MKFTVLSLETQVQYEDITVKETRGFGFKGSSFKIKVKFNGIKILVKLNFIIVSRYFGSLKIKYLSIKPVLIMLSHEATNFH